MGLGAARSVPLAFEKARITAREARALGVRWIFAPVLDLAVRPGEVHTVPGLGKVRIDAVRETELAELTAADAAADGFGSLDELIAALKEMYPSLGQAGDPAERRLYTVGFTFPAEEG